MTRTIAIIGTDIHGPEDWWATHHPEENPWLDGGRLRFDRAHLPSMENQYYELAEIAQVDGIAVGLRGIRDPGFIHIPLFSDVAQNWNHTPGVRPPTFMPFVDTGALSDIVNYDRQDEPKVKFDFANAAHREQFWSDFLGPYFTTNLFPNDRWERTPDGRVLILVWQIHPENGHGITNQSQSQLLLDLVTQQMQAGGYGTPAFILDSTWREYAPGLNFYAEHGWFRPEAGISATIRTHNGVTVGLTVPGFIDPPTFPQQRRLDRRGGDLLRENLAEMRARNADYVFIESYNNRSEAAGLYRTDARGDRELVTVRTHIELTRGEPMPEPEPEPLPTLPPGANLIGLVEIKDVVLHEALIQGKYDDTYALIVGRDRDTREGAPEGATRIRIGSLKNTGEWGWRYLDDEIMQMPAEWESGRKVMGGRVLAFRTGEHVKLYWIAAEGI